MSLRCACISGLSDASIAADDVRRYSRMIGLSRDESVYGMPGSSRSMSEPISSSWAGFAIDHSSETAIASTSLRRSSSSTAQTSASSSGITTSPSEEIRSGTSNVSRRGMYGSGYRCRKSNGRSLPPSRNTSVSRKPLVVTSAVRAVAPVMMAFVERVVA